ncbi:Dimer-Tnp-hAT domain-containing protein [Mycena venus]|uniref:Dimer-Tnp-hAT domain-containing protein n=1 Tax=Mycena venus TaxID=2733690 RepID=A0A8H7CUU9_9AGAR|nr:Dimer-Tnp-hAT domain-containing protein [Mycena venus]
MPSFIVSRASSVRSKLSDTFQKVKKKAKKTVKSLSSAASAIGRKKSASAEEIISVHSSASGGEVDDDVKANWTSGIYQFFNSNVVTKKDDNGRIFQQFSCAAPGGCKKRSGFKGVHRYQTKLDGQPASDRSSTSNLKKHAETCWGKDAVKARLTGAGTSNSPRDGNIFASFARTGQRPVKSLNSVPTLYAGFAEANRPFRIMEDRELRELLLAGRPELNIPSRRTIGRDLNAVFDRCSQRIINLLDNYNGRLSFATDAWTSPNHRAFVAWTVHLQHEGQPLVFLLDVFEVPESHTREVLACEFDAMLERFGLQNKGDG